MQRKKLELYGISTKPDAEKHGYDGLTRIIHAVEVARLIRFDPPNPPNLRSILCLQKNGTDAETCADVRADPRAETFAECLAVVRAEKLRRCKNGAEIVKKS